jgi:hypothetical protein
MRVPSRTLLSCATIALTFAAFALAEEPAKKSEKSEEKSGDKSAQTSEQENEQASEKKPNEKAAAKKAQEKVEKAKKGNDEPIVFTNDDLQALFGKAEPAEAPEADAAEGGAILVVPGSKPDQLDKTQARIKAIQAEIKRLNEMNRSLKNPYLARVETTDEEKKVYANKGSDERIRINNERIAALRQELAKLQGARPAAPAKPKR